MKISRLATRRPIFTTMVVLIVILLGIVSLTRIPIDLMPDITYPTVSISATYENAGPEEIEELITRPIEQALIAVPGVEEVSSTSSEGSSNVRVSFSWGTDLDTASNDIRDRLDRVMSRLPEGIDRPILRKFDMAAFPVLILGAFSNLDPIQMRRVIDDQVKYRIERLPGVASLDVHGGLEREIHVNVHADKLKALGLSMGQIQKKIISENVNIPAGSLERGDFDVLIRTPGEYTDLNELRETIIIVREGAPILLREIAEVEDSWRKVTRIIRVNGRPGIHLGVNKQSGTNTVAVAGAVLKELESINRDIPQIEITPILDTSNYIQRSITNVGNTLLYGGLLAILVLIVFLRSLKSTAIIALSIPISIIATFSFIYFTGFTLNLMTLGGLALGVGMLVDNSIVVLENIYRMRESYESEIAAIKGTEEVTPAIVASTLTTLAVFVPLIFVRGMAGVMYKPLAYVVALSIICALAISLTLVPMLSARFLNNYGGMKRDETSVLRRFLEACNGAFSGLEERYRLLLHFSLRHRVIVIFLVVSCFVGCLILIPFIGVEFMPSTDEGEVRINVEMAVGTRVELVDKVLAGIEETVRREVPEVHNMVTSIGGSGWRTTSHAGNMRINLNNLSERDRSSEDIANELRRRISNIPGVTVRVRPGQGLMFLRMSGSDRIEVDIRGHDLTISDMLANKVREVIVNVPGITDVRLSREVGSPEEMILVDRKRASDMNLTVSQIAEFLQSVISGDRAGNYRDAGDEFTILLKIKDADKLGTDELLDLTLSNTEGKHVVLRNVVQVRPRTGPALIERKDQNRVVRIIADYTERDLGAVLEDIRAGIRSIPVPDGFSVLFGGDYEEQQKAFNELRLGLILALLLVYMIMASLYESLRDPFVVMFSVPLAAIGVILMLILTDTTFNVQTYIGCIILGGIAVNNAILLVDYINLLRRRDGISMYSAIEEAGRRRLRPILMTALTTSLALIPLALGIGEGGEAQAPMARAVIGGLLSSMIITLIFVPVVYSFIEGGSKRAGEGNGSEDHLEQVSIQKGSVEGDI
ncbi:MAG: efflux RND transporter permease subunit [Deltaproteobacteria bacterium]|nr:efflux RND transporter permease subunit [Deltaproteobacteria bacterium]